MEFQSELWVILQDDEYDRVWDNLETEFRFNPRSAVNGLPTFSFPIPVDAYSLGEYSVWCENESINNGIIKTVFIECMEDDDYMYALDWQHTCFRYNPRIRDTIEYPVFIPDEKKPSLGYNVYFPEFYPDGDFYFFVAKDFRWGYLTHPWLNKVWVFGDKLISLIKKYSEKLGFMPCPV